MFDNILVDVLGWIGAAALLVGYGLVSSQRVQGASGAYQALNAVGSVLLLVNTFYYRAYPSSFVNVLWLGIALVAMLRAWRRSQVIGSRG
jgi:hypothetical protein